MKKLAKLTAALALAAAAAAPALAAPETFVSTAPTPSRASRTATSATRPAQPLQQDHRQGRARQGRQDRLGRHRDRHQVGRYRLRRPSTSTYQGEDFLDTAKYPTATFKSTKVVFEGDKPVAIEGNLTLKGVTKPVTLTVTSFQAMPHPMMKKDAIGANAWTVVKRTDFNAGKYAPNVGDEVTHRHRHRSHQAVSHHRCAGPSGQHGQRHHHSAGRRAADECRQRGVMHSEFNHAPDAATHLFQIWIEPREKGIAPGYEQKTFPEAEKRGRLRLIASPDGADGSVTIHADASIYAGLFDADETVTLPLNPARKAYLHVAKGMVAVNGQNLQKGDAALLANESSLTLSNAQDAEVLFFDLAP
jgi:hypothetical protein